MRRKSHLSLSAVLLVLLAFSLFQPGQAAWAASTTLVINEIDYDQPSTDKAEFIEIKNVSSGTIHLDPYEVELVNGTGGGASVYQTIDLPNVDLAAGDYYVVCGDATNVPNCDLDVSPDTNLIQNGAPDAVALKLSGAVVDAVSYEGDTGTPYTEGSGTGLKDDPAKAFSGISRFPDGTDTDQNNVDLSQRCTTPGAPNGSATTNCSDPDLITTKANNVSNATTLGHSWTWTITVANDGNGDASFTDGQTIVSDNLPDSNISYGAVNVANVANVANSANINCSIDGSFNLTCIAGGATVTVGANTGRFDVQFTATPGAIGPFANPHGGGNCSVDPGAVVTESNEGNNDCNNTVTVGPDPVGGIMFIAASPTSKLMLLAPWLMGLGAWLVLATSAGWLWWRRNG